MKTPAVILINPKSPYNVGKALRAASIFGAKSLVWTGARVDLSQYDRLPREERMKGYASVEFCVSDRPFDLFPEATPVCIELLESAECLTTFTHPTNPVYVFGPGDGSVPPVIRRHCHKFVYIPAYHCLNLSAAVDVVLYDRMAKRQLAGEEPTLPTSEMLREDRGVSEVLSKIGWEGECRRMVAPSQRAFSSDDTLRSSSAGSSSGVQESGRSRGRWCAEQLHARS